MASSSQAQRIHSGITNSQGGAVFNDDLHAARDINVNHITTVRPLARSLCRSCLISSDLFKNIQNELAAFSTALETTEETCVEFCIDMTNHSTLRNLSQNSHKMLQDLQDLKTHFDSVGAQSQVTWERMGWGTEEVADIRERLLSHIATLNLFNTTMMNSSQGRIEQMLKTFIDEIRTGKREGSIVSTRTIDSLSTDEREAWRELRKELESVGITPALFTQHSSLIFTTLRRAIVEEGLAGDMTLDDSHITAESSQEPLLLSQPIKSEAAAFSVKPNHIAAQQFCSEDTSCGEISSDEISNEINPRVVKKPTRIARIINKLFMSGTRFSKAASRGDAILIKELLEREVAPSSKDLGYALCQAAHGGHVEVVKLLLACSAIDVNSKDSAEWTPLYGAVHNGHEMVVKLLLARSDVDVNSKDYRGRSPLHEAVQNKHEMVVKLLLARSDVDANLKDNLGRSPLYLAVSMGHDTIVKLFLARSDVDVNSKDLRGWPPLLEATKLGYDAIVKLLLTRSDIDVNSEDIRRIVTVLLSDSNRT